MKHLFRFLFPMLMVVCVSCKDQTAKHSEKRQPNIVIILTDDQGWGDLSYNGNTNLSTPNIDAIAENGVSFEHFYVQPVCSPTRAELLTGRYFPRLGVYSTSAGGERFNTGETTIADLFKNAGYHTAAYGKWHSGMQPPFHPNARGFDDFYGFASGHWGNYFSPMLERNGELVKGKGYLVNDLTDKGLEFITKHKDQPFFLYLPYNTPHSPMQVPNEYWDRYRDKSLSRKYQDSTMEDVNFTRAALAMVDNIDYNVGRVSQKLEELALDKNTILVFLSDNGPNSWRWNGGLRGRKGATDEGGVRTSCFIQWKGNLPAGKKIVPLASAIDMLPTLVSLAGIKLQTSKPVDGKNLKPLLTEESPVWEDRLVFNHWNGKTSIRSQKYRLDDQNRLYDMTTDPGQSIDISRERPGVLDTLINSKKQWMTAVFPNTEKDFRPFTIGHPKFNFTHLPARDGIPYGNIKRSNKYPNDSFFTNWKSIKDSISWDAEVLADGDFEVELYYTCAASNVGALVQLSFMNNKLSTKIKAAHDPPLKGMENDRDPRIESYIKDFKPLKMGTMTLPKGRGYLTLKALNIPGDKAIDVRLLHFRRRN